MAGSQAFSSPFFRERAKLSKKRPCRAVLPKEVPQFVGDRGWLDKEFVGCFRQAFAHSRHIDHGIDQDVGDVDAAWPEISRDRFRQNALRSLGRGKAGKIRLAANSGG